MATRLHPWALDDAPVLLAQYRDSPDLTPQFGAVALATVAGSREYIASHCRFTDSSRTWAISVDRAEFDDSLFRLELGYRVNNPASCRMAMGAGFVAESIQRQKLRYGVERFDVQTRARLRTDPYPVLELLSRRC